MGNKPLYGLLVFALCLILLQVGFRICRAYIYHLYYIPESFSMCLVHSYSISSMFPELHAYV